MGTSQERTLGSRVAVTAPSLALLAILPWVAIAEGGRSPRRLLKLPTRGAPNPHVHWFRWCGEDLAGNGSLYRCRCGVVRPGL